VAVKKKSATGDYSARDLAVLEGLDAVRKRPGMYIGSNDGRGLMHCLWEILDNGVDEAIAGHCTKISVILRSDGSVEVADNGRGIPVDVEPKTKLTGVEVVLTKLHAGGKFNTDNYRFSGGLHGVGVSVVNALSQTLEVWVKRGGHEYHMAFAGGVKTSDLCQIGTAPRGKTGTRLRFWPDPRKLYSWKRRCPP